MINWVYGIMGASWGIVGLITYITSLFRPVDPVTALRGDVVTIGGAILVYLVLWRWDMQDKEKREEKKQE